MTFEVRWLSRARRDLKRLDPPVRRRIVDAVLLYSQTGHGDVRRLADVRPPEYRLRVGDWRIRFAPDPEQKVLMVLRVLPRGQAYR